MQEEFKLKVIGYVLESLPYDFEFYGENFLGPDNEESESEIYIPVE